jgi:hypothetical protein
MNLTLRRLVRTASSEQYALFDLDQTDDNYAPQSVGKLDMHYTSDAVYGTFLLWKTAMENMMEAQVHAIVEATIKELCEPMGMPAFYSVECFAPDLDSYTLFTIEEERENSDESDAP